MSQARALLQEVASAVRAQVPEAQRLELRLGVDRWRSRIERARPWQWALAELAPHPGTGLRTAYLGRPEEAWRAAALLGLPGGAAPLEPVSLLAFDGAVVSEAPLPGALRVPWSLHAVVPLTGGVEAVLATFDGELRRRLRKALAGCTRTPVTSDEDVERVNREMIEPYAQYRHGARTAHIPLAAVKRMARETGRLDVVSSQGAPVACHLGYRLTRAGRRSWVTLRFGYPEEVFTDARRLRDANSLNVHQALVWAAENGFDAYDMGSSPARPDDGLLQWKRRRGGHVEDVLPDGHFFLRLPARGAAEYLWHSPVFALEARAVTLALGVPHGLSADAALARYREFAFGGLSRVDLYSAGPLATATLERLRGVFARLPGVALRCREVTAGPEGASAATAPRGGS